MDLLGAALPALGDAFALILQPTQIMYLATGVLVGLAVGVFPGLGGSVVDWIAYGHTVQTTKDRSGFGKGEIRGVIGPESSNNAKEGGGLVPTLPFGIPGSCSMAVFIGGMILLGYEAGPQMISNDLDITYTAVWSLALANVLGAGLCIGLSGPIARLTTIRFTYLAPLLFMLIAFAAFQSRQSLGDLVALVAIGLLGVFMRRFDWSRPAFLIGFVLSDQAETYTYQVRRFAEIRLRRGFEERVDYLFSPIVIVLIVVTVASVWLAARQAKSLRPDADTPTGGKRTPVIFTALVAALLTVALVDALTIPVMNDKIFPAVVSGISLAAALGLLWQMRRRPENDPIFAGAEVSGDDAGAPHGLWATLAWFASLLALSALCGFVIALALFFVAFLRVRARAGWAMTAALTVAGTGFMVVMAGLLNRGFPPGLLQDYVALPWPLGD